MENNMKQQNSEVIKGVVMTGFGVVLFVFGLINFTNPALIPYLHLIQGIGLFLLVIGIWNLVQFWRYKKNPGELKRARIEGSDERRLWIQYRSGSNAFKVGVTMTYLALLFTGATGNTISSDLAWWVLATIVVATFMVYIISLVQYEKTN